MENKQVLVNPDIVITKLAEKVRQLTVEVAMNEAAIELLQGLLADAASQASVKASNGKGQVDKLAAVDIVEK